MTLSKKQKQKQGQLKQNQTKPIIKILINNKDIYIYFFLHTSTNDNSFVETRHLVLGIVHDLAGPIEDVLQACSDALLLAN